MTVSSDDGDQLASRMDRLKVDEAVSTWKQDSASETDNTPDLEKSTPPNISHLLNLPGEVRNKIYSFSWIAARNRDPSYDIPDFVISKGQPQWKNITGLYETNPFFRIFALLLVCKEIHREAMSIIRKECRPYVEMFTQSPLSWAVPTQLPTIKKTRELCAAVQRITIDIGLKLLHDDQYSLRACLNYEELMLDKLAKVLLKFGRLKEVVIKIAVDEDSQAHDTVAPFFTLARKGTVLILDLHHHPWESRLGKPWQVIENQIWKASRKHKAGKAEV